MKTSPPLTAVGFNPNKLDEATVKSRELAALRADASVDKDSDRKQKLLRDQSYTHLKQAVDTIRECGQFVFWKNEDRRSGYASDYKRKSTSSSAQSKASPQQ